MPSNTTRPQPYLILMQWRSRSMLASGVLALALACRSPETATDREALSTAPAPTTHVLPNVNTESEPSHTSDVTGVDSPITRSMECMGGERRITYTRRREAKDVSEVELNLSAAGHRTWSYRFHYRDEVLQRIEHRVASWHFADDSSGGQTTQDSVLERRYRLTGGATPNCVEVRVSGPSATIEAQLAKATSASIACTDVERLKSLSSRLKLATQLVDQSLLDEACSREDPSSGMKL